MSGKVIRSRARDESAWIRCRSLRTENRRSYSCTTRARHVLPRWPRGAFSASPARPATLPHEFDARLSEGDRRHGALLYRPSCDACNACEAIRIDVGEFEFSASHRRIWRRAERELRVHVGEPRADAVALRLYDQHRFGRGLARPGAAPMDSASYERFLVEACCDSYEMRFFFGDTPIAIAIVDQGETALSAVYCHYDPAFSKYSVGTYSILKQIDEARSAGRRYLYLGLYIEGAAQWNTKRGSAHTNGGSAANGGAPVDRPSVFGSMARSTARLGLRVWHKPDPVGRAVFGPFVLPDRHGFFDAIDGERHASNAAARWAELAAITTARSPTRKRSDAMDGSDACVAFIRGRLVGLAPFPFGECCLCFVVEVGDRFSGVMISHNTHKCGDGAGA